ncbi:MAG: hypothetical protein GXY44_05635 [Phycisphaerales bacterium]|nr:hypothetical protein [Phycisphaerales bacterium]
MGGISIRLNSLFRRRRSFRGGLYLPVRRDLAVPRGIRDFPDPPVLCVPMIQHDGPAARIVVQVGQRVQAGQVIGRGEKPDSLDVHAPLAGKVVALESVDTVRQSDVPAVRIATAPPVAESSEPSMALASTAPLTIEQLAELADEAGLIDFGQSATPLGRRLRQAATERLNDLIINALDFEPEPDDRNDLLDTSLDTIISSAVRLRKTLKARRLWLLVDRYDPHRVRRCRAAATGKPVRVLGLPNKYPQTHPNLLTHAVTGQEPPYGSSPARIGAFVLAIEALLALENASLHRRPLTRRLVTVTGDAVRKKGRYLIPLGTPFADVLQHVGLTGPVLRLIEGPLLTGRAVASVESVVTRQTARLLAVGRDHDYLANPGPCVRCGRCQDDCPVGLDPRALLDAYERGQIEEALPLWPHACLECGLCSFVCPAELPLSEAAARLKYLIPLKVQW